MTVAADQTPLLAKREGGGSYGTSTNNDDFPTKDGYLLDPAGLGRVVSQGQLGAVDAFGGLDGLACALGLKSTRDGLNTTQIPSQRSKFGSNELPLPPKPSLWSLVLEELKDPTIVMLLCSAVVSLILGLGLEKDYEHGWIEGTSIIVTVTLVVSVSSGTDYLKAEQFRNQQLELENGKQVQVIRDDATSLQIHPRDLVVGDIIRLAVGDISPVDGLLSEAQNMKMDESALTGETNLISKQTYDGESACDPFVISGTNVMQGSGKLVVLAVGKNSIQGKILVRIREQEQAADEKLDDEEQQKLGCWAGVTSFFSFGGPDDGADLMEKLDVIAMDIGKVGLLVAIAVFVVLVVSWSHAQFVTGGHCVNALDEEECLSLLECEWDGDSTCSRRWITEDLSTILDFFITAVTILVVAVPEGLPLAVTLALAVSVRRMMRDNNQVKHMDSCETMGSATTICSDKTGTLTENKMTVMRAYTQGRRYEYIVGESKSENLGALMLEASGGNYSMIKLLCESILLNCSPTSKVVLTETGSSYEGNATECALIKLAMQLGYDADAVRESHKKDSNLDWGVHSIPFSSEKKRMSWIVHGDRPGTFRLFSKGAPQQLFDLCDYYVKGVGSDKVDLTSLEEDEKRSFEDEVSEYQKSGLRTLAIAFRDFDKEPRRGWDDEEVESGLTLLAVVGIEDPLRASVPGAIAECRKAGIDVRMCTGDALTTAVAIAKGCGILRSSDLIDGKPKKNFAMTGAEFDDRVHLKDTSKPKVVRRVFDPEINDAVDKLADPFKLDYNGNKVLDQAAFDDLWPKIRVLARCQPEDKLALVRGMRRSRVFMDEDRCARLLEEDDINIFPDFQVVAVTGDGTNDAPALKSANVGFAMGIVGTETAKQACDIILLDDNFSSIVKAVLWGRNVFDSISKFLQFQLTVNIVAITLAVTGAFVYSQSPLSAVQMLWVNMVMDSLASLALATELPTKALLDRMPYGKRRPVVSATMGLNIVGQAVYQIGILCWVLFRPDTLPLSTPIEMEPEQGSLQWSLFFNVFVMLQLFNEFNSRRLQTAEKLRTTWSEWNVFKGCCSNPIFVGVMAGTFSMQILIVEFGGLAVNVIPGGLSPDQWVFSVVAGVGGLLWQVLINIFIAVFFPSSDEGETKLLKSTKPSEIDLEAAKLKESAEANWEKLRLGVRQGFVYSRMFKTSFRTGFKIEAATRGASRRQSDMSTEFAKELSSRKGSKLD